jgi:DNA-nicking Smr family endonuclease
MCPKFWIRRRSFYIGVVGESAKRSTARSEAAPRRPDAASGRTAAPGSDEHTLFLQAVADAVPLADRGRIAPPPAAGRPAPRPAARARFELERDGERVEGRAPGVTRRQLADLRAGRVRPEATLDLHQRTREVAREGVARFVATSVAARRRCVLIVHGRGLHSPSGPVIKEEVVLALSRAPLSRQVRAFCSAQPRDGGAGAVYVLLEKP